MTETVIGISHPHLKHLDGSKGEGFDLTITVCDDANGICPFFPGPRSMSMLDLWIAL